MQALHESLQEAIGEGNAPQILKLLDINVDPADRDSEGNTVLHHILSNENLSEKMVAKILDIFLADGIDPNTENRRRETALHLAVAKRMHDTIDLLIKYNATINANGRWFITHCLVTDENKKFWNMFDNEEKDNIMGNETATFVDWLISRGFDFHLRNDDEPGRRRGVHSAFELAEQNFLLHIIAVVLKNTKNLEFKDKIYYQDRTLFWSNPFKDGRYYWQHEEKMWYAEYKQRHTTNIMQILLDIGGSQKARYPIIDLAIPSLDSSLVEMVTNHFPEGCDERSIASSMFLCIMRHLSIFEFSTKMGKDLLDRGADVNAKDSRGRGPLYWAVCVRNLSVVQFLKDEGADFQAVDDCNRNLLHAAAEHDYFRTSVRRLLDMIVSEGVQVNAKDKLGRTPLQVAVEDNSWGAVRGLIFLGAEVDGITGDERKICDKCLREIEVLKDTFIDGRTSLYRMLRMHLHGRYVYTNNENLQKIVYSRDLKVQFPQYSYRIWPSYDEAKERHSLVERAKEAWLGLTEIDLPDECIERIFVYLSNKDLNAIIQIQ